MAAIDHTIIAFKNGKLLENLWFTKYHEWYGEPDEDEVRPFYCEVVDEINFLPFKTDRDGRIQFVDKDGKPYISADDIMEVYPMGGYYLHEKYYERLKRCHKKRIKEQEKERKLFKKSVHNYKIDCPSDYQERVYYYNKDGVEIILVVNETQNYNITYYFTETDSYVVLGGYGHNCNPYIHFYERGYGKQFERKMAKECYNWLCDDVLKEAIKTLGLEDDWGDPWYDQGEYKRLLEKLHHTHWLERDWKTYKKLIEVDPDSTDEKREEFEE